MSQPDREPAPKDPAAAADHRSENTVDEELALVDRWWRAANYLSVGQIYLRSNPLLRAPLRAEDTKPWLAPDDAAHHCRRGLGIWEFAGSEIPGEEPDAVMACAGDVPTTETVAAARLLAEELPG